MTMKTFIQQADNYPPKIAQRLRVVDESVTARMQAINATNGPRMRAWSEQANAMLQDKRLNVEDRLRVVYRIADEMAEGIAPHVACGAGCSHCCHIAVAVMEPEAAMIGKAIGVKPAKAKHRGSFKGFDYGYHNPCVFLRDGQCSIYEHRPLACRLQYNVDVDPLLCELTPPESIPVPYLNPGDMNMLAVAVCVKAGAVTLADIRAWFPKGKGGTQ